MESPGVKIDEAHADLVKGLVRAHKPLSVLEFGFGGGASCEAILSALNANGTGLEAHWIETPQGKTAIARDEFGREVR